ncbi:protein MULTIPOLAR SPINDLE 1 isoform X1 [Benincasa hispida]|uniref:protein MULTIPOLAR SPINDLE 1 isoform X1 n=1 Tax=Benincasa hispida TaxID=102211 RepID=UPI001900BFDA|nr:protein MULTIPOLAR SPINDLE 1 isoform X1 [Benincasa hispida]XP_038890474.1 protein MULTIPOLAR SPINDLE 1 isoform X1 [Benincasa hispida]XP_038890475.1 protein MULTIPOLAR SPINDLE 1 isoform X1 [Benincasa hispida]XP_038890476.1 protein MULTIPOLAR SPINDLE 1 isoform X1 [Benincasa hispida]
MSVANGRSQIPAASGGIDDQSLKLAVAISLLRSKAIQNQQRQNPPTVSSPPSSDSDALRWKRKAKERKQELIRLREVLKQAEAVDASHDDLLSQNATCKCFFFDNMGKLNPKRLEDGTDNRFNDVLRRRFLRQVRYRERGRKADNAVHRKRLLDFNEDDEVERLQASVDFLVELCDTYSPVGEANFKNWAHQAVDFILASLKDLLPKGRNMELIEGIISSLIMRLVRKMGSPVKDELGDSVSDIRFYTQQLIRELGRETYIGQRAIVYVSQRISAAGESLLFMDPFDDNYPSLHECLFIMIQLIEFMTSDYLQMWSKDENFDRLLFEEWMISILHAKKALELLESRNGLYVLYMDRVTNELANQISNIRRLRELKPDIVDDLIN